MYKEDGEYEKALRDVIKTVKLNPEFIKYIKKDEELEPIKKLEAYKIMFENER
ncbi:TPR end-of-group domain-containing protein [Fonticella tunisiensis]|uniref:TPR end-of-group domain-containing protein n=1 Tax=Fonticella tunisiensis TaxID=1096341 RepID=UPI0014152154|nr:hypothetical protein [Fonticella tunisiensis]